MLSHVLIVLGTYFSYENMKYINICIYIFKSLNKNFDFDFRTKILMVAPLFII